MRKLVIIAAIGLMTLTSQANAAHRHKAQQLHPGVAMLAYGLAKMLEASHHGMASYYGGSDGLCGHKTANGERLNCNAMTAAHRTLPFGTMVRVTHDHTGRSVVVRISDRGPFIHGRIIDLSPAAAHALGCGGVCPVSLSW